ncbi:MAG: EAL domain-containing protein [Actinobacteria bacterium]|nr:MAG: EAL domain-containing protein [Actinomycetota bacterium]
MVRTLIGAGKVPPVGEREPNARNAPDIRHEARGAGLGRGTAPSVALVERRRLQITFLVTAVLVLVSAVMAIASPSSAIGHYSALQRSILRWSVFGLATGLGLYAFEKELHLRRLLRMLVDERVLTGALSTQLTELSTLVAVAKATNAALELEDVLDLILTSALDRLGAHDGCVRLVEAGGALVPVCTRGEVVSDDSSIEDVAASCEPLLVALGPDRRGRLHAPLVHRGELVGTVSVAAPAGRAFGEYDLRTLSLFAEHGASAVAHARLYAAERAHVEELAELAFYDPLTHLANRALFVDRVEHALHRAERHRSPAAVLFLDLDNFKTVNDSLGHGAGDRLLVSVAERLRTSVRTSDTPSRLGGDEFAVLLEDVDEEKHVMIAAERIIEGLREPFTLGGREVFVTASIGVAVSSEGGQVDELLRNADAAMYSAKRQGKARCELFRPAMHAAAVELLEVHADLQRALDRNELFLEYQPTVELSTLRVVGLEALARWRHPERGVLLPKHFIGVAEETGLVSRLGRWVLEEACVKAQGWQQALGGAPLNVSVNLSARQLEDGDVVNDVAAVLATSGLAPGSLTLEITESVLMRDADAAVQRLADLRELGVRLAIDDFGTGYSSLSYLRRFPVHALKLDKIFVDTVGCDAGDEPALARAIVQLATTLGLECIAEGVERAEQVDVLRDMGCALAQGYYFAQPLDEAAAARLLSAGFVVMAAAS